uniref:RRM domain-containing protein n=1 Tax=Oryza glaberrima TaxID=4538 RepID=I1QE21_ORYGL
MAGRRPLFDLNVAHEDWDWEKGEEAEAEEEPEEVVEEGKKEVVVLEEEEEEEPHEVIMEEEVVEEEAAVGGEAEEVDGEVRRKRKDCEVLVGGLPRDAAEEDVARALADAGDVEEVRLVRDPADPRSNKGFAFVRFAAAWQARWAADDVRTAMVKGEACMICKNDANETLHLRNICFDWTKDDLAEELKTYKLENLEDINLVEDPERKGKNRGYAFLDFRTNVDGVDAFFKLQNRDIYLGTDVRAQVSFSKTLSQDDKIMEKVKSVFLDGLPPHWDEDKVREVFGKFGEIDSIHLARNMFKAKRKDFGFIGFTSRQSALDCISTVSKGGIVEGSGKVRIKASLQRPRPTLKKHSWQGITPMLGIRRGFIGKSYGDREHYGDRERYDDRERYHNRECYGDRGFGFSGHDSAVSGHIHRYERARPREAYLDSRYTNEYPRHRHSRHEESIQRDAYRSKYGHSYLERSHRDSCPDCNPSDHSSSAFYKTGRKLMASSSPGMCNCGECYVEQDAAPASSQVVPLRHQLAKPFHERSSEPDDHSASAYEAAEYKERKSSYTYLSSVELPLVHWWCSPDAESSQKDFWLLWALQFFPALWLRTFYLGMPCHVMWHCSSFTPDTYR